MRRIALSVIAAGMAGITVSALAGCSSSSSSTASGGSSSASASSPAASASSSAALSGSITVFAASSLKEAFTTIGSQFEAAHPGVKVTFSFGASSTLATQITNGAPADVFASASTKNMQQIVTAGDASSPTDFVKNVMEVAVPPSNPGHVTSVSDLAKSSVKVALCQPQVPCGATAAKVFTNAKITVGNVDAGVVYVTDVNSAGSKVKGALIPDGVNASTEYPIATVSKSANMATAQAFVAYVLSSAGQSVLAADKFEKP